MNDQDKTNDELITELQALQQENDHLKALNYKLITECKTNDSAHEKPNSEHSEAIKALDEVSELAENIIYTLREPLLVLDQDLRVVQASHSFYNFFKVTSGETIGKLIYKLGNNQWDIPKLRELLETILPEKTTFDDYEVEHDFSSIGKRVMLLNARQIKRAFGKEKIILLAIEDITERKSAEESINEEGRITTEYLDILLNHAHAPIIIWDSSLVIKRFNHEFEKLSGYKLAEVIDKKIDILFPKNKIDTTLELLNNHLGNEDPQVIEIDLLTKGKDIKTVLWNSANILDKEGTSTVATITQDITKRKQTEETLRISEQQFRHLFENSPIGKTQTRIDGSMHVNKAFSDLLGYSIDELKKLKWQEVTYPDDIKQSVEAYDNLLNGKSKFARFTKRYIHKNGTIIWADITIALQKDEEGKPLFYHTSIIDITELKQVEAELSESEKHYQTLFNEIDEGFCIIEMIFDKSGKPIDYRFLETNPAFEKQTGLINAQGKRMRELAPEHEEYWFETYGKVVLTGQSIRFSNRAEQLHRFYDVYAFRFGPPESRKVAILFNDISEHKRMEEVLRTSETHLRTLVQTIPDLIWLKDPDGGYLSCNTMFERFFGAKEADIIGKTDFDFVDQDLAGFFREKDRKAMEAGMPTSNEEWVTFADDGHQAFLETIKTPMFDLNGNLIGVLGIGRDLTERKHTEQALRENEELFRAIFDNAPIAIALIDMQGRPIISNLPLSEMIGYSTDELSKMKFTEFTFEEDIDKDMTQFIDLIEGRIFSYNMEKRYIHKNGNIIWANLYVTIIRDKSGVPQQIIGMVQDITKRKKIEKALMESEIKYRAFFENSMDAILLTSPSDGKTLAANQAACTMFGYTEAELIKLGKSGILDPTDPHLSGILVERKLHGKVKGEVTFIRKDGTRFPAEISSSIIKKQDGFEHTSWIIHDISERKQSEKESLMLAHSLKSVNECVSITDLDNKILFVNESFLKTYGYEINELIGKHISLVYSKYSKQEQVNDIFLETIQGEWQGELVNKKKDGSEFPVYLSTSVIKDKESKVIGLIGVVKDITEFKRAEDSLKDANSKLLQAQRVAQIGSWENYLDTNDLQWSEEMYNILGFPPGTPMNLAEVARVFAPGEFDRLQKALNNAINEDIPYAMDYKIVRFDGSIRYIHDEGEVFRDENGIAIKMFGITQDITRRKQTEEKLRESEEQFRKLYENARIGLYRTTPDGTILMANKAFVNLLGCPSFEMLATRNLENDSFGPTYYRKVFLEKIEKDGEVNNFESEWIRLDGSKIFVQESALAIRDTNGNILYFDGVIEDITERKRVGEELIEAKNKSEQSDRLKSSFLTNMSHEIRTPLNGILGFTDLLKEPKLSGEEQQEYIKIIEKSGKRMLNIISDIISISIVESGNLKTTISATDVNKQIEFLFTFFKPEAMQKGLEIFLTKSLAPNESIILTDKKKVHSILSNLINNAIKFTKTGSIEFGCEKKGKYLEYYVKDTGIGIVKEKMEIIFDRFRQGSESNTRNYEGAGLGLSISKAYVEVLDGKIWVESEEMTGSTFYFSIPYKAATEEKIVKKNAVSAYEPINQSRKLKILIAEDDATSELLIRIVLRIFSDDILEAATGIEAIKVCRNNPDIDLVLMDIKMPGMDGLEATRQIRQFNKEVIIIAQTAYGFAGDKKIALEAGCNEYISKPIDFNVLKLLILKHLYQKKVN